MRKRVLKEILKENLFWTILLPTTFVATFLFYLWCETYDNKKISAKKIFSKDSLGLASSNARFLEFTVSCFDDRMQIQCLSPYCSEELKKTLKKICTEMTLLNVWPIQKTKVYLHTFENFGGTCPESIKKRAGCLPHFFKGSHETPMGFSDSFIYLPSNILKDSPNELTAILAHEITHALTSGAKSKMTRTVNEFFSVLIQWKIMGKGFYSSCNGPEFNGNFLRSFSGGYVFPPSDNWLLNKVHECRYGQLEYLVSQIDRASPFLYEALWHKLKNSDKGVIDLEKLRDWIEETDKQVWKIVKNFRILQEARKKPEIAIVKNGEFYYFFVYYLLNNEKDKVFRTGLHLVWRRGGAIKGFMTSTSDLNYIAISDHGLKSGDVIRIRSTVLGEELIEKIVIP